VFPTEQQAYHRLRWDPRFDVRRCSVVISLRPSGTQRLPFLELDTNAVPWHRIVELWVDDELAWSRPQRIDRLDELAARASGASGASGASAQEPAGEPAQALGGEPEVPHRFDARAQRWTAGALEPPQPQQQPGALRVATWNLLHDRHDAAALASEQRWQDALDRLAALDADLIALVEVTPRIWELLLTQPWIRQRYATSHGPAARSLAPFGQALLSRYPIREAQVAAISRRSVLVATIAAGERSLGVAVLHLTSNRVDGAAALRHAQLAAIAGHVRAVRRDGWIVAGDFNADPEEHAAHLAALGAVDAWDALRAGEPGFTFDVERNALAARMSVRGRSARYDRILAIGPSLQPASVELFGIEPGPSGLPPSDHFGLRADLALAAPALADVSLAPPSRKTALALVPPPDAWGAWGALQRIRCREDRGFPRWPPHVTLCHPFVDESWLDRAARVVDELAAGVAPFELVLSRVDAIDARGATIVMLPERRSARAVQQLRSALVRPFGALHGEEREFRPHLTIARLEGGRPRPQLPPQRWRVDRVTILRETAGRFEPVHEAVLGGRAPRAAAPGAPPSPPPAEAPALRVIEALRAAAGQPGLEPEIQIEPFGSSVYAPGHAADLDLLVRASAEVAAQLARALGLRALGTDPPRLRGAIGGTAVDLMFVPPGAPDDDRTRGLVAGPRDCALLAEHLRHHGRHHAFLAAWPAVRRFAVARAIAANGLGWFGSFGWALLLAIPLVHDEELCTAPAGRVLPAWLRWLGARRPGARIGLDAIRDDDPEPLWLAAPAPPSRNVARGLTSGTAALWFDEVRRAARAAGDAPNDEAAAQRAAIDLAADPPPGATLVVTGTDEAQRGRYDGRFRGLLLELERTVGQVRPWGRFDRAADAWQHRITVAHDRERESRELVEAWLARELAPGGSERPTVTREPR
jgi:poly(A) polymerase